MVSNNNKKASKSVKIYQQQFSRMLSLTDDIRYIAVSKTLASCEITVKCLGFWVRKIETVARKTTNSFPYLGLILLNLSLPSLLGPC
jgi:hypothetical protein